MGILRKGMCIAPKEADSSGTNFGKGRTRIIPSQAVSLRSSLLTAFPSTLVYFADHPQKSLGYMELSAGKVLKLSLLELRGFKLIALVSLLCKGCFLLCEVALGEHFIRKNTGYRPSPGLPPVRPTALSASHRHPVLTSQQGFHNTWGQGKHVTDPEAALYTYALLPLTHLFALGQCADPVVKCSDDGVIIPMGNSKIKNRTLGYNEFIVYNEGQVNLRLASF